MKRIASLILALTLCLGLALPARAAEGAGYPDTENHYAKVAVETWSGYGVLKGYPDGTFQPDGSITRAEMAVVLDRVMGYQNTAENTFTDVPGNAWYTQSVLRLAGEGILQGRQEGLMLPKAPITRQEAFVALARAMSLTESEKAPGFSDDKDIADWAKGYVSAMKEAGYINGDKNGALRPGDGITRAEVVTVLHNMAAGFVNADGTYSADCKGNLIVNAHDVRLKDMTVDGDLIVADGVADGDVYLEKVTVKGDVILRGCGANSFHIMPGCVVGNIIVTKTTKGMIRLVNESGKSIPVVWINDGSDGVVLDGNALGEVVVACDAPVTVNAKSVKTLSVTGNTSLTISKDTTVSSLELTETAREAKVTVEGKVTELINDAGIEIDNKGSVASNTGSSGGGSPIYYPSSSTKRETLSEVTIQLLPPVFAGIPDPADPMGVGFTAKTEWTNADGTPASYRWKAADSAEKDTFTADQAYQATVTLTPASRYTFADDLKVKVTDGREPATEYTPVRSEKSGNNWVVTLEYEKTDAKEFVESVRVSGPSAIGLNETGKLTVGYQDNYLVDPAGHTYQWYKCDAAGANKTAIAGATAKEYEISAADTASVGKLYYCCDVTEQDKPYPSDAIEVTVQDDLDLSKLKTPVLPEKLDIEEGNGIYLGVSERGRITGLLNHRSITYYASVFYTASVTKIDGTVQEISAETSENSSYYTPIRVQEDSEGNGYSYFAHDHEMRNFLEDTFGNILLDRRQIRDVTVTGIKLKVTPHYYDSATGSKDFEELAATKVYDISDTPITYHFVRNTDDMEQWGQVAKEGYPCSDEQYIYKVTKSEIFDGAYRVELGHLDGATPVTPLTLDPEKFRMVSTGWVPEEHSNYIYPTELYFAGPVWAGEMYCDKIEDLKYFTGYLEYRPLKEKDGQPVFEYYYYSIDPHQSAGLSIENI